MYIILYNDLKTFVPILIIILMSEHIFGAIVKTAGVIWLASSLGTPIVASYYVNMLGENANLVCLGESGLLKNVKTNKLIEEKHSSFENHLASSGFFPFFMILGPFSIPVSAIYMTTASFSFLHYKYCLKKN